ncbi:hypothetical protein FZ103_00150 [Streptomonospora sp. PA3]|uniref:hypothetical protein n=1 Tax=Streptomonospora sp. PA3 TaxID=2607326 RepID=UPI0012DBFF3A|nr:hypothetical protein [Streptomonospora sp. PA3]MUL39605.1 hypothetical protein [Streptomonospora sp. PA3]
MTTANDFLMGGGIPAAKFEQIGRVLTGAIAVPPEVQQQKDFNSGEPLFWDDGSPRQQIKLVLDTAERNPEDPDDDGQRALYVKSGMLKAVRAAVKASRSKGLEVGGTLTITYTGDGEPSRKGLNPPKQYSATYQPPAPGAAANDVLMGGQQPPAAPPAAPAPVPQAQAAPAAPAAMTPEQQAAIAQLTPEQRAALGL